MEYLTHALRIKVETVEYLISHSDNICESNKHGWTCLHKALSKGAEEEVLRMLIEAGVDVNA